MDVPRYPPIAAKPPVVYEVMAYNIGAAAFGGAVEKYHLGRVETGELLPWTGGLGSQVVEALAKKVMSVNLPVVEIKQDGKPIYLVIRPDLNKVLTCRILQKYFGQRMVATLRPRRKLLRGLLAAVRRLRRRKAKGKYHIHVYGVAREYEVDVEASSLEHAKARALNTVVTGHGDPGREVKSDCSYIAIGFPEEEATARTW